MRQRRVHVTPKQVDRLFEDVQALPAVPVGEHLSDDQFIGYSMATLSPDEMSKVDLHLASCSDCAIEMERLLEASEVWEGEKGEQRLTELGTQMIAQLSESRQPDLLGPRVDNLRQVEKSLQSLFELNQESLEEDKLAWAAEAKAETVRKIWTYRESPSGMHGQGFLDSNGDLIFVLSSPQMELQGRRLHLRISSEEGEVWQERVLQANELKTEVGATFVVPRYELPQQGATVSLSLGEAES